MVSGVGVRLTGGLVAGYVGFRIGQTVADGMSGFSAFLWRLVPPLALLMLGLLLTPLLVRATWSILQRQLGTTRLSTVVLGLAGLLVGLLAAALLSFPLGQLPAPFGDVVPFIVTLVAAAAGVAAFVSREEELMQLLSRYVPVLLPRGGQGQAAVQEFLLDTSVIIDGRLADICATGFLQGTLVVPRFILDELRHIADSPDAVRRARGRRGLEVLSRMQREGPLPLVIAEDVPPANGEEVDSRLVTLAQTRRAPIVTNDFNLNRVAELQGVHVLNVNQLANAVRSVILPGEEMTVRVVQEGKETGQGVAFLDDGTMVVVENGRRYLNETTDIVVTRVLQTVAGRMIFAQPRG